MLKIRKTKKRVKIRNFSAPALHTEHGHPTFLFFCYLSRIVGLNGGIKVNVTNCINQATVAFGMLSIIHGDRPKLILPN